jgi:hypothetical protein
VLAFASVVTQWRIVPLASGKLWYAGLDYAAVRARLDPAPELWDDLSVMELAAREAANSR